MSTSNANTSTSADTARGAAISTIQHAISTLVRSVQHPALGAFVSGEAGITLGGPYHQALTRIVHQGPITATMLARELEVDPSTLSRHTSALERRGLVRRDPDPADRRAFHLTATDEGAAVFERGRRHWVDTIDGVVREWPDDTVVAFASAFEDFAARIRSLVSHAIDETKQSRRL